ncbi:MAG TPA: LCP family protein [Chloroflexia bacterium]|nr:LCP family protein [Chloroflexia bacterium]
MLNVFKKHWKRILALASLVVLLLVGFGLFRVVSFVGSTTGGGRSQGYLTTATPDVTTPTGVQNQVFNSLTGTPTPALPALTPTPDFSNSSLVQKVKGGAPVTMLLFGYGGYGHAGQWLTDTIMLLRYDPKNKTLLELNIPRDLYVFIPYGGANNGRWAKINTVFASIMEWDKPTQQSLDTRYRWDNDQKKYDSAANLLADTVELVTGQRVDYWAGLSFEGFRRFIDAMGGVEVNVQRYFIDHKYPRNDDDQVDASVMTVEFYPGKQLMNGERAIEYARSRYSDSPEEGNDFARSQRQMNLINAVKDKALKENLVLKIFDYMQALQGQLRFSLDFGEIASLANYLNSSEGKSLLQQTRLVPAVLNDKLLIDKTLDGAYILVPREGQGQYDQLQRWLRFAILNADMKDDEIKVQVLNSNGTPGIAAKFSDFLIGQGFRVLQEQDGENQEQSELLDYTMGKSPATVARLKSYLPNLKVTELSPDKKPANAPSGVDMQLRLGKDFNGNLPNLSVGNDNAGK